MIFSVLPKDPIDRDQLVGVEKAREKEVQAAFLDRMESEGQSCEMLITGSSPIDVREKPSKDL